MRGSETCYILACFRLVIFKSKKDKLCFGNVPLKQQGSVTTALRYFRLHTSLITMVTIDLVLLLRS